MTMPFSLQKYNKIIFRMHLFDIIAFVARIIIAVIFILAAANKVTQVHTFQQNVAAYHMLPLFMLPIFASTVPWIEMFVGIYLLFGFCIRTVSKVTIALLLMFMIAIAYALLTNQPVGNCGCFAQSEVLERISWYDEWRDVVFLILTLIIAAFPNSILSVDNFLLKKNTPVNKK